jgi:hypothetical protein
MGLKATIERGSVALCPLSATVRTLSADIKKSAFLYLTY